MELDITYPYSLEGDLGILEFHTKDLGNGTASKVLTTNIEMSIKNAIIVVGCGILYAITILGKHISLVKPKRIERYRH